MVGTAKDPNPRLATLLLRAADTGARRGELRAPRWRHFDEEAGIHIVAAIGEARTIYEKDT